MILSWSIFFNQPWLTKQLSVGQEIAVYGKYDLRKQSLSAYKLLANKNSDDGMAPIYSINRQIKQKKLQTMIDLAIAESMDEMGNAVPEDLRKHYRLMLTRTWSSPCTTLKTWLRLRRPAEALFSGNSSSFKCSWP